MEKTLKKICAAASLALVSFASSGAVTYLGSINDNDCSGYFGTSPTCIASWSVGGVVVLPATPLIAKYNVNDDGEITNTSDGFEANSAAFPSITFDDFTITFDDADLKSGTWTYNKDASDPVLTAFVLKASNNFALFQVTGGQLSGDWTTTGFSLVDGKGLSHMSFYDGGGGGGANGNGNGVPEPASLALVGLGLLGAAAIGRRRRV